MGKYLALTVLLPLQAFWCIWGFFLAWGAADSGTGKPFWQLVCEELNGRDPGLTQLWVFATTINACLLLIAAYVLIQLVVRKFRDKQAHPKLQ
jgi:hypothetical protein